MNSLAQRGHADGEDRARATVTYCLEHGERGDGRPFYDENVIGWFEVKENEMRAAGATDPEIVEYLKAGNAAFNGHLRDASNYIANGLADGAGNRRDRRAAKSKAKRGHLRLV